MMPPIAFYHHAKKLETFNDQFWIKCAKTPIFDTSSPRQTDQRTNKGDYYRPHWVNLGSKVSFSRKFSCKNFQSNLFFSLFLTIPQMKLFQILTYNLDTCQNTAPSTGVLMSIFWIITYIQKPLKNADMSKMGTIKILVQYCVFLLLFFVSVP